MGIASFLGNLPWDKIADIAAGAAEINRPGGSLANLDRNRLAQKLMQQQMEENTIDFENKKKRIGAMDALANMGPGPTVPRSRDFERIAPISIDELKGAPTFSNQNAIDALNKNPLPAPELDAARMQFRKDATDFSQQREKNLLTAYPELAGQLALKSMTPEYKNVGNSLVRIDGDKVEPVFTNEPTKDWENPNWVKVQGELAKLRRPEQQPLPVIAKWDNVAKANTNVSQEQLRAEPTRYENPHAPRTMNLYDVNGNVVGTADPNDPSVQDDIAAGKYRTSPPKAPSESATKAGFNAGRIIDAMNQMKPIIQKTPKALTSAALEYTDDNFIGRMFSSDEEQIVRNNMGDIIDAVLTLGTGASYNTEQLKAQRANLMPRAGESFDIQQGKMLKILSLYERAKTAARDAGTELPDAGEFKSLIEMSGVLKKAPDSGTLNAPKKGAQAPMGNVPDGVDAKIWAHMTPAERSLWPQ